MQLQFKKPELSPEEQSRIETRKQSEEAIEEIKSRFESVELLIESEKHTDARILLSYLKKDLEAMENRVAGVGSDLSVDEIPENQKELQDYFEQLNRTFSQKQKEYQRFKKSQLHTAQDDFHFTYLLTGSLITVILVAMIGTWQYYKSVYFKMNPEATAQVFYMEKGDSVFAQLRSVTKRIGFTRDWSPVRLGFESSRNIESIRIDPFLQERIRFQIRNVHFLDNQGTKIATKKIRLNQVGFLENMKNYGFAGVKPGSMEPGKVPEFISINTDPHIIFKGLDIRGVTEVEYEIRVTEEWNNYKKQGN